MKKRLSLLYQQKDSRVLKHYLVRHEQDLYAWILSNTTNLNKYPNLRFIERVFCIENNLADRPKCLECNNNVGFHDGKYRLYCSRLCKNKSETDREKIRDAKKAWSEEYKIKLRQKRKETCRQKFGGNAPASSITVLEKMRKTYKERTGFEFAMQNPEVKQKTKETNLQKYGVVWNIRSDFTNEQRRLGFQKRYGVDNIVHLPHLCQQGMISKYGVSNPSQVKEFLEKKKQTWLEKYGVDNPSKSLEIIQLIKQIKIERGHQIPDELLTDYERYCREVWLETERSFRRHQDLINPLSVTRSIEYHLDHNFSIFEGFKHNIDATIIGHYTNLQMLPRWINASKGSKCWKLKEDLIEEYNRACKKI